MADEARVSQNVVETITEPSSEVQVTQNVVETIVTIPIELYISQNAVETLTVVPITSQITQNILEIFGLSISLDLSGIYYFNPAITHDKYYGDRSTPGTPGIDKKIPDPTIKTAYIGD